MTPPASGGRPAPTKSRLASARRLNHHWTLPRSTLLLANLSSSAFFSESAGCGVPRRHFITRETEHGQFVANFNTLPVQPPSWWCLSSLVVQMKARGVAVLGNRLVISAVLQNAPDPDIAAVTTLSEEYRRTPYRVIL